MEDSHQAGFTEGTPWIRVNSNYKEINAKQQLSDPDSIFHYYQKLIRLRKEKPVIVYGAFEALYRDHDQILHIPEPLRERSFSQSAISVSMWQKWKFRKNFRKMQNV